MIKETILNNPVVKHRADPFIYRHDDGYYYFVATVPSYDRIEISRSRDIAGLSDAIPQVVWRQHLEGEMCHHIWAPELHFIDGVWYLYFAAAHSEDQWRIRMYVLMCSDSNPMLGTWMECGQVKSLWDSFSLDATVFKYKESLYMIWAQKDPNIEGNTNLYIDKMTNPWTLCGKQIMLSRPEYSWETKGFKVNEGPAVLIEGENIYVTYSASKTDASYCMGLLTCKPGGNPLDPKHWLKSAKPVFVTDEERSIYGPGHNCFTRSHDDQKIFMVYHARVNDKIEGDPLDDPNRHTFVKTVSIDGDHLVLGRPVAVTEYRGHL